MLLLVRMLLTSVSTKLIIWDSCMSSSPTGVHISYHSTTENVNSFSMPKSPTHFLQNMWPYT